MTTTSVFSPSDPSLKDLLARNIANSQRVIAGEFEKALVDIIEQMEHPPTTAQGMMPIQEVVERIASSLRQGFTGLNPNGFDFCTWMWETAPLHQIDVPAASAEGSKAAFGFCHLRTLAAMTVREYVIHQPEVCDSLIELLDASVQWEDAKTLVKLGMQEYFLANFDEEFSHLCHIASSPSPMRRLVPVLTATARMMQVPESRDAALQILSLAEDASSHPMVGPALDRLRQALDITHAAQ